MKMCWLSLIKKEHKSLFYFIWINFTLSLIIGCISSQNRYYSYLHMLVVLRSVCVCVCVIYFPFISFICDAKSVCLFVHRCTIKHIYGIIKCLYIVIRYSVIRIVIGVISFLNFIYYWQNLVSNLRFNHSLHISIKSLGNCDYIVSKRMGIERKTVSGMIFEL